MRCAFCGSDDTKVIETRETSEEVTRRRRECLKCEKRFTTYERVEMNPLIVVKKNSVRESFDRQKIRAGILRACEKRPISLEQIDDVVDEIESELRSADKAEILSNKVGMLVMKKLKKLDKIAYIRFASVYREFRDIDDFEKELKKLIRK